MEPFVLVVDENVAPQVGLGGECFVAHGTIVRSLVVDARLERHFPLQMRIVEEGLLIPLLVVVQLNPVIITFNDNHCENVTGFKNINLFPLNNFLLYHMG